MVGTFAALYARGRGGTVPHGESTERTSTRTGTAPAACAGVRAVDDGEAAPADWH